MRTKLLPMMISLLILFSSISAFSIDTQETIQIKLQIANITAIVNDKKVTLDAPPLIIKNRTFVPLRFIAEAFGAKVDWESSSQTVTIKLDNPIYYQNKSMEQEIEISRLNELLKSKDQSILNLNALIDKKDTEIQSLKEEISNLKKEIERLRKENENLKKGSNADIEFKNVQLFINGRRVTTSLEPFLYKGKVFASLEDICKPLGKTFRWDSEKSIFYIEDETEEKPSFDVPEKIGIYTNSFGYYIYVADPIHNRVIKYSTEGLYLDTIIKTVSTHSNGDSWELKKVVDIVTCRLTDVIGVVDAINNHSYIYELNGHTHHKNGKSGIQDEDTQELWGIAMTEVDDFKLQALLDRKGCKISLWAPPPGGIKDPSDGTWIRDIGSQGSDDGQLLNPEGICYDKTQHLWVADTGNRRLVEFDMEGNFIQNLNNFQEPCAVGVDFIQSQGNKLYILDRGTKTIYIYSPQIKLLKTIKLENLERPSGMTIDADNHIWVTDANQNKAYKYNQEGKELLVIPNLLSPKEITRRIVRVFVDKYIMTVNDVVKVSTPPYLKDEYIMIPVKFISEGLGADFVKKGANKSIIILDGHQVELTDGQPTAIVNGEEVRLEIPSEAKNGFTHISSVDFGNLFPVTVIINPLDLRYSSTSVTVIYPK